MASDTPADTSFWKAKAAIAKTFAARKPLAPTSTRDTLCEVVPKLFLSGCGLEENKSLLQKHGVTHILQVGKELEPSHGAEEFAYHHCSVYDLEEEDLVKHFPECFRFITTGRGTGAVLVHCAAGISRSASVVIGYLMASEGLNLEAARAKVKAARPIVSPNAGFLLQLHAFEAAGCSAEGWAGWSLERFLQARSSAWPRGAVPASAANHVAGACEATPPELASEDSLSAAGSPAHSPARAATAGSGGGAAAFPGGGVEAAAGGEAGMGHGGVGASVFAQVAAVAPGMQGGFCGAGVGGTRRQLLFGASEAAGAAEPADPQAHARPHPQTHGSDALQRLSAPQLPAAAATTPGAPAPAPSAWWASGASRSPWPQPLTAPLPDRRLTQPAVAPPPPPGHPGPWLGTGANHMPPARHTISGVPDEAAAISFAFATAAAQPGGGAGWPAAHSALAAAQAHTPIHVEAAGAGDAAGWRRTHGGRPPRGSADGTGGGLLGVAPAAAPAWRGAGPRQPPAPAAPRSLGPISEQLLLLQPGQAAGSAGASQQYGGSLHGAGRAPPAQLVQQPDAPAALGQQAPALLGSSGRPLPPRRSVSENVLAVAAAGPRPAAPRPTACADALQAPLLAGGPGGGTDPWVGAAAAAAATDAAAAAALAPGSAAGCLQESKDSCGSAATATRQSTGSDSSASGCGSEDGPTGRGGRPGLGLGQGARSLGRAVSAGAAALAAWCTPAASPAYFPDSVSPHDAGGAPEAYGSSAAGDGQRGRARAGPLRPLLTPADLDRTPSKSSAADLAAMGGAASRAAAAMAAAAAEGGEGGPEGAAAAAGHLSPASPLAARSPPMDAAPRPAGGPPLPPHLTAALLLAASTSAAGGGSPPGLAGAAAHVRSDAEIAVSRASSVGGASAASSPGHGVQAAAGQARAHAHPHHGPHAREKQQHEQPSPAGARARAAGPPGEAGKAGGGSKASRLATATYAARISSSSGTGDAPGQGTPHTLRAAASGERGSVGRPGSGAGNISPVGRQRSGAPSPSPLVSRQLKPIAIRGRASGGGGAAEQAGDGSGGGGTPLHKRVMRSITSLLGRVGRGDRSASSSPTAHGTAAPPGGAALPPHEHLTSAAGAADVQQMVPEPMVGAASAAQVPGASSARPSGAGAAGSGAALGPGQEPALLRGQDRSLLGPVDGGSGGGGAGAAGQLTLPGVGVRAAVALPPAASYGSASMWVLQDGGASMWVLQDGGAPMRALQDGGQGPARPARVSEAGAGAATSPRPRTRRTSDDPDDGDGDVVGLDLLPDAPFRWSSGQGSAGREGAELAEHGVPGAGQGVLLATQTELRGAAGARRGGARHMSMDGSGAPPGGMAWGARGRGSAIVGGSAKGDALLAGVAAAPAPPSLQKGAAFGELGGAWGNQAAAGGAASALAGSGRLSWRNLQLLGGAGGGGAAAPGGASAHAATCTIDTSLTLASAAAAPAAASGGLAPERRRARSSHSGTLAALPGAPGAAGPAGRVSLTGAAAYMPMAPPPTLVSSFASAAAASAVQEELGRGLHTGPAPASQVPAPDPSPAAHAAARPPALPAVAEHPGLPASPRSDPPSQQPAAQQSTASRTPPAAAHARALALRAPWYGSRSAASLASMASNGAGSGELAATPGGAASAAAAPGRAAARSSSAGASSSPTAAAAAATAAFDATDAISTASGGGAGSVWEGRAGSVAGGQEAPAPAQSHPRAWGRQKSLHLHTASRQSAGSAPAAPPQSPSPLSPPQGGAAHAVPAPAGAGPASGTGAAAFAARPAARSRHGSSSSPRGAPTIPPRISAEGADPAAGPRSDARGGARPESPRSPPAVPDPFDDAAAAPPTPSAAADTTGTLQHGAPGAAPAGAAPTAAPSAAPAPAAASQPLPDPSLLRPVLGRRLLPMPSPSAIAGSPAATPRLGHGGAAAAPVSPTLPAEIAAVPSLQRLLPLADPGAGGGGAWEDAAGGAAAAAPAQQHGGGVRLTPAASLDAAPRLPAGAALAAGPGPAGGLGASPTAVRLPDLRVTLPSGARARGGGGRGGSSGGASDASGSRRSGGGSEGRAARAAASPGRPGVRSPCQVGGSHSGSEDGAPW